MTPAPSAGGEGSKKKRNRRRSRSKSSKRPSLKKQPYAKRVDEISAGGLVIDSSGTKGLLIGRIDLKDQSREKLLWSLPKGHIEAGESPEQAAIREVKEETGLVHVEIIKKLTITHHTYHQDGMTILKETHWFQMFAETATNSKLIPQIEEDIEAIEWVEMTSITTYLENSYDTIRNVLSLL